MKTSRSSNSHMNLKFSKRKPLWILIPLFVLLLAGIMTIVFAFATGSPLNIGMELKGGYSITVKSTFINDENYSDYTDKIQDIADDLRDDSGKSYGLKIDDFRKLGENNNYSIYVTYKGINGFSSEKMENVGTAFQGELQNLFTRQAPTVTVSSGEATITYEKSMTAFASDIEAQIKAEYPTAVLEWIDPVPSSGTLDENEVYSTQLKFVNAGTLGATKEKITLAATYYDQFSATISEASSVSGSIGRDFMGYAISAACVALVAAFGYFAIRFKSITTGLAVALGMLLDIIMLLSLVSIFFIEISGLIMVAVLATMLFSIYNKAVSFNQIRENIKDFGAEMSTTEIVNKSVNEVLRRSIIILIIMAIFTVVLAVASIIGAAFGVALLALPLIFGFVAAAFTSLIISPLLWLLVNTDTKAPKEKTKVKKKEQTTI